jgi:UDP-N-acetyl-D-mannosaminuronate dehydrogenase
MPEYVVEQALKLTEDIGTPIVSLLGLAFRGGVSDTRLSPTYKIIEHLRSRGINQIRVHDPLVKRDIALPEGVALTQDLGLAMTGADLIILVADHPEYKKLSGENTGSAAVYDGRGILDRSRFAQARFASIGRPPS